MIRFQCDCGRELQGRDEDAGRQAKCPTCGRILTIPGRGTADEPPVALPAAPPADAVRPQRPRGRYDDDDRGRDRPPRPDRPAQPEATSGKATAAAILGFLSFPCLVGNLFFAGFAAIVVGLLALRDISASAGRLGGKWLALTGMLLGVAGLMCGGLSGVSYLFVKPRVDEARNRVVDQINLVQIGMAMHNLHNTYNYFPAAAAYRDANGRPLLSWRVALLPYLEQDNLHRQFRFNEPWDSPHNIQFVRQMPKTYLMPGQTNDGTTHYQVFVGVGSLFEDLTAGGRRPFQPQGGFVGIPPPGRGFRITDVQDGTSNTIMVATASRAVPWTKPEDIPFDPAALSLPPLGGHFRYTPGGNVLMADGSVRWLRPDVPPQTLKAMITRSGGEVVNIP